MKKIAMMTGVALTLLLSACGGGTKAPGNNTGGGNTGGGNTGGDIPVASKAPTLYLTSIRGGGGGQSTISTYSDVIAKCTFTYSGSMNKSVVATRTETTEYAGYPFRHTADAPNVFDGNLSIVATCQNSAGTATRRLLN